MYHPVLAKIDRPGFSQGGLLRHLSTSVLIASCFISSAKVIQKGQSVAGNLYHHSKQIQTKKRHTNFDNAKQKRCVHERYL